MARSCTSRDTLWWRVSVLVIYEAATESELGCHGNGDVTRGANLPRLSHTARASSHYLALMGGLLQEQIFKDYVIDDVIRWSEAYDVTIICNEMPTD